MRNSIPLAGVFFGLPLLPGMLSPACADPAIPGQVAQTQVDASAYYRLHYEG